MARTGAAPQARTAREALALGTIHGARCLDARARSVRSSPASLADVALWRLDDLDHAGIADLVAALVLGPRPLVDTLLVGGRPSRTAASRPPTRRHRARPAARAAVCRRWRYDGRGLAQGRDRRERPPPPDGIPKVKGEFAYSSDLWADGTLWGATLRSPTRAPASAS